MDVFKTKNVMKQIKKKTLSFKMNALNIFLDINEDVKLKEVKDIDSIIINNVTDITNNELVNIFPDIKEKLITGDNGMELIINITNDINKKTEKENKIYENIFKQKI